MEPRRIHTADFQQKLRLMKGEHAAQKAMGLAAPQVPQSYSSPPLLCDIIDVCECERVPFLDYFQINWQSRVICFGHQYDEATLSAMRTSGSPDLFATRWLTQTGYQSFLFRMYTVRAMLDTDRIPLILVSTVHTVRAKRTCADRSFCHHKFFRISLFL